LKGKAKAELLAELIPRCCHPCGWFHATLGECMLQCQLSVAQAPACWSIVGLGCANFTVLRVLDLAAGTHVLFSMLLPHF
jgi:hypothetical protein